MRKRIIAIIAIGLIACLTLVGLVSCKDTRSGYPDGDKYSVGNGEYAASSVRAINIAWTAGSATITASSEYTSVQISEVNSKSGEDWALHRYLDPDGTLWIKPVSASVDEDEIPSSGEWTTKTLTITMPEISLASFYVENHGATILATNIQAGSLETSNTGYKTTVTNSRITGDVKMNTSVFSGDISFGGEATGNVNISTPYGDATFSTSVVPQSIEIHGRGLVQATIPETTEYTVTYYATTSFTYSNEFSGMVETSNPEGYGTEYTTKKLGSGAIPIKLICATRQIGDKNNTKLFKYTPAN